MQNIGKLKDYLYKTLGLLCKEEKPALSYSKSLPIYLKNSFNFHILSIEDVQFFIAEPLGKMKGAALLSSAKKLKELTGFCILIMLPQIDTNLRRTLISGKVDFVVIGKQIYLPSMCMYLNERGLSLNVVGKMILSPAAQILLLYHLQVCSLERRTLKDVALLLNYSAKTVSVVTAELVKATICTLEVQGRNKLLNFVQLGKDLWKTVEPLLESPIVQIYYIDELPDELENIVRISYDSALAHYTFLAESKQRTVAIAKRNPLVRGLLDNGNLHPTEGEIRVELWKYDPVLLSDSSFVDKLSLALCYKNNDDERINKELAGLIDGVKW